MNLSMNLSIRMAIKYIELSYIVSSLVRYIWSKIIKYGHEKSSKQTMKNQVSKPWNMEQANHEISSK